MARQGGEGVESPVEWFCPDPRAIFPLASFRVPDSLARLVRHRLFVIRSDTAFEQVMRACAQPRVQEPGTWIDEGMIRAYCELHEIGHAHSVEAWKVERGSEVLVGGLYGVHIGGAFMGESMFVRPDLGGSNASKICLVHLVEHLRRRGFMLLDTQFTNEHLLQFGCVEIRASEYLKRLEIATATEVAWEWPTAAP